LRKPKYEIVLFVARVSLQPQELVRIFSPSWPCAQAQLVYSAFSLRVPTDAEREFLCKQEQYIIDGKKQN
jgi:hypothetical protein